MILTGSGEKAFSVGGGPKPVAEDAAPIEKLPMVTLFTQLLQIIRLIPKPVLCAVNGMASAGGNVIQMVCDLTIASENAKFGQIGPRFGTFDAGYGTALLSRMIGDKKAREFWFTCRQYTAAECLAMGLVNAVVPLEALAAEADKWVDEIVKFSPTALAAVKASFNADTAGAVANQAMAGVALNAYYNTEECKETQKAFAEKRVPDIAKYR